MQPSDKTIDKYQKHENCLKCGKSLEYNKGWKYCSEQCRKLYLKSQWRKRRKEHIQAYAREYRRAKNGGNRSHTHPAKLREDKCLNCHASEDLQLAHVKPLWAGGTHRYVITLCRSCHSRFDKLLHDFWEIVESDMV